MDQIKVPPPKVESYRKQIIWSVIVLIIVGILLLIFVNVFLGAIISLLGAVFGIGAQVVANNPLD